MKMTFLWVTFVGLDEWTVADTYKGLGSVPCGSVFVGIDEWTVAEPVLVCAEALRSVLSIEPK